MADARIKPFGFLLTKGQLFAIMALAVFFILVTIRACAKIQRQRESASAVAVETGLTLGSFPLPTEPEPAVLSVAPMPEEPDSVEEVEKDVSAEAPSRDPFLFSAEIRQKLDNRLRAQALSDAEESASHWTEALPGKTPREQTIEKLTLSATVIGRAGVVALINDQFVVPGQTVEGLRVLEIHSREVILEDTYGKVILKMSK